MIGVDIESIARFNKETGDHIESLDVQEGIIQVGLMAGFIVQKLKEKKLRQFVLTERRFLTRVFQPAVKRCSTLARSATR